jgi:hypothetical protein
MSRKIRVKTLDKRHRQPANCRKHAREARVLAELLEKRRLFAALVVNGSSGDDYFFLDVDSTFIYVNTNGIQIPQPRAFYDAIEIHGLGGDDDININSTADEPVDIYPGDGLDHTTIGWSTSDLDDLSARVYVHSDGTDGSDDELDIVDQNDTGNVSFTIDETNGPMRLIKPDPANESEEVWWGESNVTTTLYLNDGDNQVTVDSDVSMGGTDEQLIIRGLLPTNSLDGNDSVTFNGKIAAGNLFQFLGGGENDTLLLSGDAFSGSASVSFDGGTGTDLLTVSDSAATETYQFNAAGTQLSMIDGAQTGVINYTATEDIGLTSTSTTQISTFAINGLAPSADLSISAGGGDDAFVIGDGAISTSDFGTLVDLDLSGGNGIDSITVEDGGSTVATTHDWTFLAYDHPGFGTLTFSSISSATLNAGSGADIINTESALGLTDMTINGGAGSDTFNVGPSGTRIDVNGGSPTSGSPGDRLTLTTGSGAIGGELQAGSGTAGTYTFENKSDLNFTGIETATQPAAPPTAANLVSSSDSGRSSSDNITKLTSLVFSGTAASGDFVRLYRDNTQIGGASSVSGTWTTSNLSCPTGDASYAIVVRRQDDNGLLSNPSTALNVRVDTLAPANLAAPDMLFSDDSGKSSTDNITSVTRPTFTGTRELDAIVRLVEGAFTVATDSATGSLPFSLLPTAALANAAHTLALTQEDVAGNVSAAANSTVVTIDTIAPAAPSSAPDLQASSDSGSLATDNITNDATPSFAVSAPELVQLLEGGTNVKADYAAPSNVTSSLLSTDGTHTYSARSIDLAGNVSSASSGLTITLDTAAPASPASAPDLTSSTDSGMSFTDNITRNIFPAFSIAGPELIRLLDGTTPLADYFNPGVINTSISTNGVHSITARSVDLAGNASAPTAALSVTIDNVAPSAPTAAPDLQTADDTGISSTDNITNRGTIHFTVNAPELVRLQIGGATYVDYASPPSITLPDLVVSGTIFVTARSVDVAGNESAPSSGVNVTLDYNAPQLTSSAFNFEVAQLLDMNFSENMGNTISLADLSVSNLTPPSAGTIPSAQLALSVGTNTARLSFPGVPTGILPDGNYEVALNSSGITDVAGNELSATSPISFFVLSGDANHDHTVDTVDFNLLAANFGQTARSFGQGDFNYDSVVDTVDFNMLAANFSKTLSAPVGSASPASAAPNASVFNTTVPITARQDETLFEDLLPG